MEPSSRQHSLVIYSIIYSSIYSTIYSFVYSFTSNFVSSFISTLMCSLGYKVIYKARITCNFGLAKAIPFKSSKCHHILWFLERVTPQHIVVEIKIRLCSLFRIQKRGRIDVRIPVGYKCESWKSNAPQTYLCNFAGTSLPIENFCYLMQKFSVGLHSVIIFILGSEKPGRMTSRRAC